MRLVKKQQRSGGLVPEGAGRNQPNQVATARTANDRFVSLNMELQMAMKEYDAAITTLTATAHQGPLKPVSPAQPRHLRAANQSS